MRKIKKIVVHCSASPDHLDIGVEEIRRWHIKDNGWSDVGYHWIICRDGKCEAGRPESKIGAHTRGHNRHSIGICWIGIDSITEAQRKTLDRIIRGMLKLYDLSVEDVLGHCELNSKKTCPNLDMNKLRKSLKAKKYLPKGPSDAEVEISLIDIENQVFEE